MDARRVDADSSGAMDGVARLSKRPLRAVELRLTEERASATERQAGIAPEVSDGLLAAGAR